MDNFYDDFSGKNKQRSHLGLGIFLGLLIAALIGSAVFACYSYFAMLKPAQEPDGGLSPNQEENVVREDTGVVSPSLPPVTSVPDETQYYSAVVTAAEKATPSVVGISNYGTVQDFFGRRSEQLLATGSGVIIRSDGYIVTNYHVIENATELIVNLGPDEEYTAQVVGSDEPTDLAVIKIDKQGLPAAEMADSDKLRVGEPAIAIGNPLGLDFQRSVTLGVVSAVERSITISGQRFSFIQTDAAINDGNSGGALVNISGLLIGINTAKIKITGVEGMGFAIPSNTVRQISNALIENGRVVRPWIGIYISTLTQLEAERLDLSVETGVLIQDVVDGGPAEKAGIKQMDVILEIEGTQISDTTQLQQLIQKYSVGQSISVLLARGDETIALQVTLEALPEQIN